MGMPASCNTKMGPIGLAVGFDVYWIQTNRKKKQIKNPMELNLCNKLRFSRFYIFATQTMSFVRSNNRSFIIRWIRHKDHFDRIMYDAIHLVVWIKSGILLFISFN